jgi:acyl-CoA synthetase (NDP forming)
MTALLRHKAVVLVDTIEELIDAADLLARARPPAAAPVSSPIQAPSRLRARFWRR